MQYIVEFDIAAIFIFFIALFLHFQRKNLQIEQNTFYVSFVIVSLVASVFETISTVLCKYNQTFPEYVYWIVNILNFLAINTIPLIYSLYCNSLVGFYYSISQKQKKTLRQLLTYPTLILWIFVIISPFTYKLLNYNFVFAILPGNIYSRGGFGFYYLYISMLFFFLSLCYTRLVFEISDPSRRLRHDPFCPAPPSGASAFHFQWRGSLHNPRQSLQLPVLRKPGIFSKAERSSNQ